MAEKSRFVREGEQFERVPLAVKATLEVTLMIRDQMTYGEIEEAIILAASRRPLITKIERLHK